MFNRGGLRFILALRIVQPIITETLLKRTDKYSGAGLLIALYIMPTECLVAEACQTSHLGIKFRVKQNKAEL